jgi:hypothetical protein
VRFVERCQRRREAVVEQMTSYELQHDVRVQRNAGDARRLRPSLVFYRLGDVEHERRLAEIGSNRLAQTVQTDDGVHRSADDAARHNRQRFAVSREEQLAVLDDQRATNNVAVSERCAIRLAAIAVQIAAPIVTVEAKRSSLAALCVVKALKLIQVCETTKFCPTGKRLSVKLASHRPIEIVLRVPTLSTSISK